MNQDVSDPLHPVTIANGTKERFVGLFAHEFAEQYLVILVFMNIMV